MTKNNAKDRLGALIALACRSPADSQPEIGEEQLAAFIEHRLSSKEAAAVRQALANDAALYARWLDATAAITASNAIRARSARPRIASIWWRDLLSSPTMISGAATAVLAVGIALSLLHQPSYITELDQSYAQLFASIQTESLFAPKSRSLDAAADAAEIFSVGLDHGRLLGQSALEGTKTDLNETACDGIEHSECLELFRLGTQWGRWSTLQRTFCGQAAPIADFWQRQASILQALESKTMALDQQPPHFQSMAHCQ